MDELLSTQSTSLHFVLCVVMVMVIGTVMLRNERLKHMDAIVTSLCVAESEACWSSWCMVCGWIEV